MHSDPIKPGPRSPDQWMPLFLAQLALDPDLEQACQSGGVTKEAVEAQRAHSGYFDAAYRIILREHRRCAREAGLPVPSIPARSDFSLNASRTEARRETPPVVAVFRAEISTLVLLCQRLADDFGLTAIGERSVFEWFNHERRVQLEKLLLSIGDTDPAEAESLLSHFAALREHLPPGSIAHPPGH